VKKYKKIILVHVPIDVKYLNATTLFAPPLGLLSIKSYLETKSENFDVQILDGMILTQEEIELEISKLHPDFVGLSVQLLSYKNALTIARLAKDIGAFVFLGGHHATQIAPQIMMRQYKSIDCVICGDGEKAVFNICSGAKLEDVLNIVFYDQHSRGITTNEREDLDFKLPELPNPYKAKNINFTPYKEKLQNSRFKFNHGAYYRIYSHKGCPYRASSEKNSNSEKKKCVFCGRADRGYRFTTVENYFLYFKLLCVNENDFVFDVGDDLLGKENWVRKAVEYKEKYFETDLNIGTYGRGDRINDSIAKLLQRLGVKDITVGIESGDDSVLSGIGKNICSSNTYLKAARILFENGISMTPSYVFGLPGETRRTVDNTIQHAQKIIALSNDIMGMAPNEIVANLLEPLPGSEAFNVLVKAFPQKYLDNDELELYEMQKDYFSLIYNFKTDREYELYRKEIRVAGKEINGLAEFSDSQGWLADEMLL